MDFDQLLTPHLSGLEETLLQATLRGSLGVATDYAMTADAQNAIGRNELGHMVAAHLATGGKRLRGLLPMALVQAGAGPAEAALRLGAAIEMAHNGTLVHDDVQDGDRLRRGQPTLWTQVGLPQAINAGDAMLVAPLVWLLNSPHDQRQVGAQLAQLLGHAVVETIRGQVADVGWRLVQRPTVEDLLGVHLAKTGPLFGVCLQGAAILLGLPVANQHTCQRAARHLGLAFQVRDDLLDLIGKKGRGQPGADLREGKLTVPAVLAAEQDTEGFSELLQRLTAATDGAPLADAEVAQWVAWIGEHGGETAARTLFDDELAAFESLASSALGPGPAQVIGALAHRLGLLDG